MRAALLIVAAVLVLSLATASEAPPNAYWVDWTSGASGPDGYTATGAIAAEAGPVTVTYHNPQHIAFAQYDGGVDYWTDADGSRDPATSPYTSAAVANIPPASDIIALNTAGMQSLTFSEPIANPVFAFVSLNGNGYAFDRDFDILSFGHPDDGNACGYWGCGTAYKEVVDLGNGVLEYQLLGTGEPHGTLRFVGEFTSVTWKSLSSEDWNGFTVGVADSCRGGATNDLDGDGVSDLCDADDDGDCYSDVDETALGADPRDARSIPTLAGPVTLPLAVTGQHGPGLCPPTTGPA